MTKKLPSKSPKQIEGKKRKFKIAKNWPFLGFFKFQTQIFLSFLVFHQKKCSFGLKTYFCFPQKIHRLVSPIQNYRLVWGGVGAPFFDPHHRNKKSDFASIVVKCKETRPIFENLLLISTLFTMGPLSDLTKKRRGTCIYMLFLTIALLNYSTPGPFRHSKQKKQTLFFFLFLDKHNVKVNRQQDSTGTFMQAKNDL